MMPIEINPLETARFGVTAARVSDPSVDPGVVEKAARDHDVKLLSVRIPVSDHARVHAFEAAGYQLMDTLVYYEKVLADLREGPPAASDARCRPADASDAVAVGLVAENAFANYGGHYHVDPRIDIRDADRAYVEWAESSVRQTAADTPVIVAELHDRIVGFLTMRFTDDRSGEIVLNAVDPDCQKQGVYNLLLASALELGGERNARRLFTSTQIDNYAVQRLWTRAGFAHFRSVHTFHKWR